MSDAGKAVFLSYASQDAAAAKRICDALRAAGVEVWFDQSELVVGDAWDAKIRGQIKECALLIPIISAATQARTEGYFRLEWRLADQRTHLMAKGRPFLLPVVIDATRDAEAHVPDSFTEVQWTRLPGGETSPAFAERVKKLLGGGPSSGEAASHRPSPASQELSPPKKKRRRWLVPVIVVVAVAAAVWQQRRNNEQAPATEPKTATVPAAPLSAAQKLVAQARQIYEDGDELNRENLYLAEELVQRALTLDPAEPAAWELGAWLSYTMVWHLIDESGARRETLLRQANRAVALAPNAVSAQVVLANARMAVLSSAPDNGLSQIGEIERSLQRLAEREPQNWMVQRALGTAYRFMNRTDDAIRALQRALELSGEHPMASGDIVNVLIRRQRFAEAEAILARALARHRSGRLLTFDVVVKCRWRGDTAGALKAIEAWPGWLLQENRGIAVAWQAGYWGRQPVRALRAVQQFPGEYVRDVNFSGPRAVLSARAHELAGNAAAAQSDWRVVAQRCDQDLAANPQDVIALFWKAWALARLGDQGGAQTMATLLRQRLQSVASNFFKTNTVASLWATVGWTDLALAELRAQLETPVDGYSLTRAYLELEPAFDPLRGDPRFREILSAAPAPPMASALAATDDKSVAVLAFANLSSDKEQEYFSDGISEELLNVLAKVPGLKVSARTSAFYFKGKEVPIPEIAKQLGVAYVVEGSVRKQGERVRITAQLIKAADGFHVWSDTFTRDLKDIFAVQDEIAGLIAKNLELKIGVVAAARTVDPEAYRLYLEALPEIASRTRAGFDRAEQLINRAIARDPGFVPAQAALAVVWCLREVQNNEIDSRDTPMRQRIVAQAELAVKMGPDWAEAQAACGYVYTVALRFAEGEPFLRRAIQLNPNYAPAYLWLGRNLLGRGYIEEAIAALKRAVEVDPLSHRTLDNLAFTLIDAGRNQEALGYVDQALRIRPDSNQAMAVKAQALARMGRLPEALALIDQIKLGVDNIDEYITEVYVRAGRRDKLEAILAATRTDNRIRFILLAALGRNDEALDALDQAIVDWGFMDTFLFNPLVDHLRTHPRFIAKLQSANLTEVHARAQAWRAAHPPEKPEAKK